MSISNLQSINLDVTNMIGECAVHDKDNSQFASLIRVKKKIEFFIRKEREQKLADRLAENINGMCNLENEELK